MLRICFLFTIFFKFIEECSNTLSNEEGICIPVKQCSILLKKIKQPLTEDVIQLLRRTHCGYQGKDPLVCCEEEISMESFKIVEDHPNFSLFDPINCGGLSRTRITNGNKTRIGEYKFMALIGYKYKEEDNNTYYRCGGTLINSRYILTAAHCIKGLENRIVNIRLGEYDMEQDPDCDHAKNSQATICAPPVKNVFFDELISHPLYDIRTLHNDIGLIRLSESVEYADGIQPICLPLGKELQGKILADGMMATITGWGITETEKPSRYLLKTTVPIFPYNECKKVFPKKLKVSSSQICAGGQNDRADSCHGDSGGPLFISLEPTASSRMLNIPVQAVQYGIVSYGPRKCGRLGVPAIYTRVSHYIEWILNSIRP